MKYILLSTSGTLPHVSTNKQLDSQLVSAPPLTHNRNYNPWLRERDGIHYLITLITTFSQASRSVLRCSRRERRETSFNWEKPRQQGHTLSDKCHRAGCWRTSDSRNDYRERKRERNERGEDNMWNEQMITWLSHDHKTTPTSSSQASSSISMSSSVMVSSVSYNWPMSISIPQLLKNRAFTSRNTIMWRVAYSLVSC